MLRILALLLLAATVLLGLPSRVAAALEGEVVRAEAADRDDCCPRPASDGELDCCDIDLGRCCGVGLMLPAPALLATVAPTGWMEPPLSLSNHCLHPRANGPPPTPPPIA